MLKLVALDPTKKRYASAEALKMYQPLKAHARARHQVSPSLVKQRWSFRQWGMRWMVGLQALDPINFTVPENHWLGRTGDWKLLTGSWRQFGGAVDLAMQGCRGSSCV